MTHPVSPALFERLEKYARSIDAGATTTDAAIEAGSELIAFLNRFFEQFLGNVLGTSIHGPSDADAATARGLRLARELSPEQKALVQRFEEYCRYAPDIFSADYGGDDSLFSEFHTEYMRYLIEDIDAWARATGDADVASAASKACEAYLAAAA